MTSHFESGCLQLLACCEIAKTDDAILGDLLEERHAGRSVFWFLREVLTLLIAGILRQIASDKLLSAGAIVAGLVLSIVLRTLLTRFVDIAGGGALPSFLAASTAFAITGVALRYKFPEYSVAMTVAFTAYALLAKLSLVLMNLDRFQSASNSAHFPLSVAAILIPPIFAVSSAVTVRWNSATFKPAED